MIKPQARKTASLVVRRPAWDRQDFEPLLIDYSITVSRLTTT